jgi:hypothetical protein
MPLICSDLTRHYGLPFLNSDKNFYIHVGVWQLPTKLQQTVPSGRNRHRQHHHFET